MTKHKPTLIEHFKNIKDPRIQRKQLHKLDDIFFITLCAVICGCDGWVAIEKFANIKRTWFEQYLSLENGIPSHDTFGRVFSLIDPKQFQACFSSWIKEIVKNVTGDVGALTVNVFDALMTSHPINPLFIWLAHGHMIINWHLGK